tara:strand:+ start:637 stop:819 length:183 start_codon:yes stop_codon:yes gene_type:complete
MPKWNFNGSINHDFDDEDFNVDENYKGFERIQKKGKMEEELKSAKKKSSIKHQHRPDKES